MLEIVATALYFWLRDILSLVQLHLKYPFHLLSA